jgi:hypothetical protein
MTIAVPPGRRTRWNSVIACDLGGRWGDDAVRVDEFEGVVGERQLDDRSLHEPRVLQLGSPPSEFERSRAEVDPGVARAGTDEPRGVGADPTSGLEKVALSSTLESHDLRDVGLRARSDEPPPQ